MFFKRRKTIFLYYFLCGKIIREWNTENTHKLTGLLGKNEKRKRENGEREKTPKRKLFWKMKIYETSSQKKR